MRYAWLLTIAACSTPPAPGPATPPSPDVHSPPVIDSHVHLAYWNVTDQLERAGVLAAVDLAAPLEHLPVAPHVIFAGPMLTRPGGYPLDSWGADGYGTGCADAAAVTAAIDRAIAHGASVIKIALDDNGLDPSLLAGAVQYAHGKSLVVVVHALSNASAAAAGAAGADVLGHTPTEPLDATTIAAWSHGTVISTLAAFGGFTEAITNLAKLRAAGTRVLYGTDLGNLRDAGPSADEIALLARAGLDNAAIVDAMTTAPAAFWKISVGDSYVVVDDPKNPNSYLAPRAVVLDGKSLK